MDQSERTQDESQSAPVGDGTGMLGTPGTMSKEDEGMARTEQTAPVGVPTEPGGIAPGSVAVPWANSTADVPTSREVLGTPGNLGPTGTPANVEPGTPGVPGSPTPAPTGEQFTSYNVAGSAGPQTPSGADEDLGGTPTPGG